MPRDDRKQLILRELERTARGPVVPVRFHPRRRRRRRSPNTAVFGGERYYA